MTLTEFLLARIVDTIATAREIQALAVTHGMQPDDPRDPALRLARTMLAECRSKRRIVERATRALRWDRNPEGIPAERVADWAWSTLEDMAAVYADHPDYREEWKP